MTDEETMARQVERRRGPERGRREEESNTSAN